MEINSFKQPELVALIEKEFKGKSSRYDVRPREEHLSVTDQTSMMGNTKHINYQDLQPDNIYALRTTTTDLRSGKQDTSFNLFLDGKMAQTYYYQNTPKDNLILNHQVQHGIIISGDVNNDLLARLQMTPKDFNSMLVVSTMQAESFTNTQKQQIEQASKIAEKVFNEIPLKKEYAFDTLPKGAQQDLYKYYEMTHGENRQITHVDARTIQEKKEAIQANEPYVYVGLIHSKDNFTPSVAYTSEREYLNAIEQGLKNNPQNLGYETISASPQLHKQVEDLVYKSYGLTNPYPIEYYTEQGRTPLSLQESNNPKISIMDLAKEMGFTYRNTNQEGDTIMQKSIHPNENTPQITQIDLVIKNADNPLTNIVTVEYSRFNDSKSLTQDSNFNPIAQDAEFHLPFKDFVALTKPLNSEEILKTMESSKEIVGTITYKDTNEKISFTEPEKYLNALHDALDTQPHNIKYEILANDQQLKDKVKDMMYDFFGMETPQQANGQSQIKIMDLAKELGFSYEGKDSLLGDVVMRYKYDYDNKENGQKETAHVALSIQNPDDPQKNTVNVITTFFDANNKTIGTYYDNNQTFDQFVNLTKSIGSQEVLRAMEQKTAETNSQQNILDPAFIHKMITELEQKGGWNNKNDFEVDLYHMLKVTNPETLTKSQYEGQAVEIIKLAQQKPENEIAAKILEKANVPVFNINQQSNIETQPIESFKYETASIQHRDYLQNNLQDKFKLEPDTITKFATFMEAAHPIDRTYRDLTADIVVFPYVKVDNQFNLEGHLQSTMSAKVNPLKEGITDHTNMPIGYERYTKDQTIPVKPYTTHAAIEGGVWMATEAQKPNQVKDVIMFNSAIDAMSFYEMHKNSIDLKNTALISVGNLARTNQIYGIVERFPEAQLHSAFQNTLLGNLSTITAVSLASIGPVKFKTDETKNTIDFTTYYDKFSLPIKDINLQNFKEHAHIKNKGVVYDLEKDLKIHSPQGRSYNEDLVQSKQQSEKQEQHRTMKL